MCLSPIIFFLSEIFSNGSVLSALYKASPIIASLLSTESIDFDPFHTPAMKEHLQYDLQ